MQNPPPLDVLRSKVFAVHVRRAPLTGSELPTGISGQTFRPTLHFALGGQVQSHDRGAWNDARFAVVTTLGNLESQLLSVAPHDSFILGPLKLSEQTVYVAPEGTDASGLPGGVPVVFYDPAEKSLRQAIDETIASKGGWSIKMRPGDVDFGMPAKLGDEDIDAPGFFKALLDAHPEVSFGTHGQSIGGQGHRFGWIDAITRGVPAAFAAPHPADLRLASAISKHHLAKLDAWMATQDVSDEARADYASKRAATVSHDEAIDQLASTLEAELAKSGESRVSKPEAFAMTFNSVPPAEFEEFMAANRALFAGLPKECEANFRVGYAATRWVVSGSETARAEGLDTMLARALPDAGTAKDVILSPLSHFFDRANRCLPDALQLIATPAVREHFNRDGYTLGDGQPSSLAEFLLAHPQGTGLAADPVGEVAPALQAAARTLLEAGLGPQFRGLTWDPLAAAKAETLDAGLAVSRAYSAMRSTLASDLETYAHQPLNSLPRSDQPGDLAPLLARVNTGTPRAFFDALGLGERFEKAYPSDEAFWGTGKTLQQVVDGLRAQR